MALPLILMGAAFAASAVTAGVRASKAKKLDKKYEQMEANLQPVSPEQIEYLNRVKSQERAMRMGTDISSAVGRRGIDQSLSTTQRNLMKMGSSGVSNMLRAQTGATQGYADLAGRSQNAANQLFMFQHPIIEGMSKARYDLERSKSQRVMAQGAMARQGANEAMSAAVGSLAAGADYASGGTGGLG
jgi:hypothetical protein